MPAPTSEACQPSRPLPFIVINGTADRTMPYGGGRTRAGFSVWSTDRTLDFFRTLNGCNDVEQRSNLPHWRGRDGTNVVVESWTQCARGPVTLYKIVGGGHGILSVLKRRFRRL